MTDPKTPVPHDDLPLGEDQLSQVVGGHTNTYRCDCCDELFATSALCADHENYCCG